MSAILPNDIESYWVEKEVILQLIEEGKICSLNAVVFQPDIIHYYAVYFLLGSLLMPLSNRMLSVAMAAIVLLSLVLIITLDYDRGWDWHNLHYTDFWSTNGMLRNLLFNGWHPVIPWLCFLLFGIQISRLNLSRQAIQWRLLFGGLLVFVTVTTLAASVQRLITDPELALLFNTGPIPAMPLYVLSAGGLSAALVGGCLLLTTQIPALRLWSLVTPVGRQTLTWYILHIYLGMGLIDATVGLHNCDSTAAIQAALVFMVVAVFIAKIWSTRFKHGPLEAVLKHLTGTKPQSPANTNKPDG